MEPIEELSKYIFASKYARYDENLGRRETWKEAVSRVENMHLKKFDWLSDEHLKKIRWAFDLVRDQRVVPSMRSIQYGGVAIEKNNARLYNCATMHIDSVESFSEAFFLLLSGCGVGFGLSEKFMNNMPSLIPASVVDSVRKEEVYVIDDSIEGWADALGVLISSYLVQTPWSGANVKFDYSSIRPEGAPLVTSGGKAPGPDGLRDCLDRVRVELDTAARSGRGKLRTVEAYDILMHAADATLSGGVRRSACSVMFDPDDEEMMLAKSGNWWETHPHRARSNNSVRLLINENLDFGSFQSFFDVTKQWGEPGFVFAYDDYTLYNPCFEIGMRPVIEKDWELYPGQGVKTGVGFCNLSSINCTKLESIEDFLECVEAAAIIGTLQATYTDFTYLRPEAKIIAERDALLGISMTGILESPIACDKENQKIGATAAVKINEDWAEILGINAAKRVTCVKPEGTSSLALGVMSSGIHPAHARKMFRRVTANRNEPIFQHFFAKNSDLCEPSVTGGGGRDWKITFPIEVSGDAVTKDDMGAIQHLRFILDTQKNWVRSGSGKRNETLMSHNVSATVVVGEHEWDSVARFVFDHKNHFSALSFLSKTGDKDYAQAPFEAIVTDEDDEKYNKLLGMMRPVDYSDMSEGEDNTDFMGELVCSGGACEIK